MPPKPEYLRLFNEIVVNVWHTKRADAANYLAAINSQLDDLKQRKDKLTNWIKCSSSKRRLPNYV